MVYFSRPNQRLVCFHHTRRFLFCKRGAQGPMRIQSSTDMSQASLPSPSEPLPRGIHLSVASPCPKNLLVSLAGKKWDEMEGPAVFVIAASATRASTTSR